MKRTLFLLLSVFLRAFVGAEIYDCFLFFNEEEVLRIHLEELYPAVDHFVLVEADKTFSGLDKEYLF